MPRLIFALILLSGCSMRSVNRTALLASTVALACDWGQTRSAAENGWPMAYEANPIMGSTPSPREVDRYFAATALINLAIYAVLPERWRWAPSAAVVTVQASVINDNRRMPAVTRPTCGL